MGRTTSKLSAPSYGRIRHLICDTQPLDRITQSDAKCILPDYRALIRANTILWYDQLEAEASLNQWKLHVKNIARDLRKMIFIIHRQKFIDRPGLIFDDVGQMIKVGGLVIVATSIPMTEYQLDYHHRASRQPTDADRLAITRRILGA